MPFRAALGAAAMPAVPALAASLFELGMLPPRVLGDLLQQYKSLQRRLEATPLYTNACVGLGLLVHGCVAAGYAGLHEQQTGVRRRAVSTHECPATRPRYEGPGFPAVERRGPILTNLLHPCLKISPLPPSPIVTHFCPPFSLVLGTLWVRCWVLYPPPGLGTSEAWKVSVGA